MPVSRVLICLRMLIRECIKELKDIHILEAHCFNKIHYTSSDLKPNIFIRLVWTKLITTKTM